VLVGDRSVAGTSRNISQGGMFIEMSESIPMDAVVRVRFSLPGLTDGSLETEARVRWVEREGQGRGVGVQFAALRPIEVWAINQLFRKVRG